MDCQRCGTAVEAYLANVMRRGDGCPRCGRAKAAASRRLAPHIALAEIRRAGFTPVDKYVDANTRIAVRHDACGRLASVCLTDVRTGSTSCLACRIDAQAARQRISEAVATAEFAAAKVRFTTHLRGTTANRGAHWRLDLWRQPTAAPSAIGTRHHLEGDPGPRQCPGQERAAVAAIHPAIPKPRQVPPVQPAQQLGSTVAVACISSSHVHGQQQAQGVNQQVALAAVDPLGAVVAVRPPFRWSTRFGCQDRGAGRRPSTLPHPLTSAQHTHDLSQRPSSRQQRK
jgi:hypothetical protein